MLALASAAAQAGPADKSESKKSASTEVKTGMAAGAAIGALIGGPFGAGVGFIVGTIGGAVTEKARAGTKRANALEAQLAVTQQELIDAQSALASAAEKSGNDPMLAQLAQRLRADVLFRTGSAELDPNALGKLTDLGAVIAAYPHLVIEIDGYADPRGKAGENLELSQQRAMAVRAALLVGGAAADNIRVVAHGEQLSTAPKDDLEAYAWERRVSLSVTSNAPAQVANAQ
jgi:outer membrane protein OmpA-like peptidoglycan-associated protein